MENLEDIKVGDKVIINYSFRDNCIGVVSRITKTLIIVGNMRFKKRNGFKCIKKDVSHIFISKATPKRIAEIEEEEKRCRLVRQIIGYPLYDLSTEELEKVYKLINK